MIRAVAVVELNKSSPRTNERALTAHPPGEPYKTPWHVAQARTNLSPAKTPAQVSQIGLPLSCPFAMHARDAAPKPYPTGGNGMILCLLVSPPCWKRKYAVRETVKKKTHASIVCVHTHTHARSTVSQLTKERSTHAEPAARLALDVSKRERGQSGGIVETDGAWPVAAWEPSTPCLVRAHLRTNPATGNGCTCI